MKLYSLKEMLSFQSTWVLAGAAGAVAAWDQAPPEVKQIIPLDMQAKIVVGTYILGLFVRAIKGEAALRKG